jgi:hypothetical protein
MVAAPYNPTILVPTILASYQHPFLNKFSFHLKRHGDSGAIFAVAPRIEWARTFISENKHAWTFSFFFRKP